MIPQSVFGQKRRDMRRRRSRATNSKWTLIGRISLLGLVALAFSLFYYFGGQDYLSFESLKNNRNRLIAYTQENYPVAVASFIGLYIAQTALALPASMIFTLAGGLLFGVALGTVYDIIGGTVGATIAFLASRYVLRDFVERRLGSRFRTLQQGFRQHGFTYLLSLRLMPLAPFFVVNLLSGLTPIRIRSFVGATVLGSIPVTLVYANAGRQIGSIEEPSDVASPAVLISLGLLGLLAITPIVYRWIKARRT